MAGNSTPSVTWSVCLISRHIPFHQRINWISARSFLSKFLVTQTRDPESVFAYTDSVMCEPILDIDRRQELLLDPGLIGGRTARSGGS